MRGSGKDLLILLCFHGKLTSFALFLKSEGKSSTKKPKIWNIHEIEKFLFTQQVLVTTTPRLFGIGNLLVLRKVRKDEHRCKQAKVFCKEASEDEMIAPGEEALTCLNNGLPGEGLDALQCCCLCGKVSRIHIYRLKNGWMSHGRYTCKVHRPLLALQFHETTLAKVNRIVYWQEVT